MVGLGDDVAERDGRFGARRGRVVFEDEARVERSHRVVRRRGAGSAGSGRVCQTGSHGHSMSAAQPAAAGGVGRPAATKRRRTNSAVRVSCSAQRSALWAAQRRCPHRVLASRRRSRARAMNPRATASPQDGAGETDAGAVAGPSSSAGQERAEGALVGATKPGGACVSSPRRLVVVLEHWARILQKNLLSRLSCSQSAS